MKKIIALVVAVLMMAAIAVPAFAAWDTQYNEDGNVTIVTFGVQEGYVVKIPQKVDFGYALAKDIEISASGVIIAGGTSLKVTVKSEQYDDESDTWQLIDTATHMEDGVAVPNSANVSYMISLDENAEQTVVSNETVVLTVASAAVFDDEGNPKGNSGSAKLYFTTNGTSQVGTYQDRLTFSASVS